LVGELTDESAVDIQVQKLENFLGVIRNLDEGGFVDWTHFEQQEVISCYCLEDRLKTEFDRWAMVKRKGLSATAGLYTEMDVAGHLGSTQHL